jgi:hypothetical protein
MSGTLFIFCAPESIFSDIEVTRSSLMFCTPRLIFGGTEGAGSNFHVLLLPNPFLTVLRTRGPVFLFCAPGLIFGGTESARSNFHVLHSRLIFVDNEGVRSHFFVSLPDSFSVVAKVSSLVLMFCALGPAFRATVDVGTLFIFYALESIFSDIEATESSLMFCTPRLIFGSTEGTGSNFHVLRSRTHFRRY